VGDCATLRAVNPAGLRAATWLLDEEAFGRRDAPAPGAQRAAYLVAAQLQALGLQPGGDRGSFLQEVPITVDEPRKPSLTLVQGDVETTLAPERDYQVLEAHGDAQVVVDAELALVDEQTAPGWLRGRVAVVPVPKAQETARAAAAVARLRAQGAAAVLLCTRGPDGRAAYHELQQHLQRPTVRPTGAPRPAAPAGRLVVALAPPACELLLATAAAGPRAAASPVLPLRARAQAALQSRTARAWNAVGVYRAARAPAAPPIVVVARLDGPGVDVAALLEVGRALVTLQARPPRPVVLAAVAGAPDAPGLGLPQLEGSLPAKPRPHVHVLLRGAPAEAPVGAARLVEAITRGAAKAPAP
jgi:hypothetical protein